ncbi:MAG: hypothetical protein RLP02_06950, partial [Coleofasciculus sp. C2-GNP5-27]
MNNVREHICQEPASRQALQSALIEDRFCLYFQPIFPLLQGDEGHVHKEILIRMVGQDGRIIPPNYFLP